jgi:hypothetical protein
MSLYGAGVLTDVSAKALHKLLIFMVATDEGWDSRPADERDYFMQKIAARMEVWQCVATTAKGTRCSSDAAWPFDRCGTHLTADEKSWRAGEQARLKAEKARRNYWRDIGQDEQEGHADDLARQKQERENESAWLIQEAELDETRRERYRQQEKE